jgi:hypothetical protein
MKFLIRSCAFGALALSIINVSSASSLWMEGSSGLGAGPAAAKYSIGNGGAVGPLTSATTVVAYYNAINCGGTQISGQIVNGAYSFSRNSSVQANAVSVYNIGVVGGIADMTSVLSVEVNPVEADSSFVFIEAATPTVCFNVICDVALTQCTYSGAARAVTLQ